MHRLIPGILDWWRTVRPWIRYPAALLVIAASVIGLATTRIGFGRLWGFAAALGVIMLLIGPTEPGKKGLPLLRGRRAGQVRRRHTRRQRRRAAQGGHG